jgi:hypothetical protein
MIPEFRRSQRQKTKRTLHGSWAMTLIERRYRAALADAESSLASSVSESSVYPVLFWWKGLR